MDADPRFWAGKTVCVTGGTGFLGWHIVQQFHELGVRCRVFGLAPAAPLLREKLQPFAPMYGDILDAQAVRRAVSGCDVVIHAAGNVAMWGPGLQRMYDIHLRGTRNVLQALVPGARLVHTSSVTTIGATADGSLLDESVSFNLPSLKVDYVAAKRASEDIVLAEARRGTHAVVVNPGYLIGPEDFDHSAMGRFFLRCWRGRTPLIPPGGFNVADVRDVAKGHLLAAERGRPGQRYILGGENRSLAELMHQLAAIAGMSSRWWLRMPWTLLACFARLAELRAALVRKEPYPGIQQARLNRYTWFYTSSKAQKELDYRPRPLRESLHDTFAWCCQQGWLERKTKIAYVPTAAHVRQP